MCFVCLDILKRVKISAGVKKNLPPHKKKKRKEKRKQKSKVLFSSDTCAKKMGAIFVYKGDPPVFEFLGTHFFCFFVCLEISIILLKNVIVLCVEMAEIFMKITKKL